MPAAPAAAAPDAPSSTEVAETPARRGESLSVEGIVHVYAGAPAVDRGTNQPNLFIDPKSSESFLPYFSRGFRDDFIQRRYVEALCRY